MATGPPSAAKGDLHLRAVAESDLPIFFEHQLDPEGNRMAALRPRDREAFMAHWRSILADGTVAAKTIVLDGRVAGNITSFLASSGEREVGYWIGREFWGKGIATAALTEFLRHDEARPLYAHVAKHNFGSIRVLEKCGFRVSGQDRSPADGRRDEVDELILKLEA